jgi:rhomboid protease GluP
MTLEERINYCRVCEHKGFNPKYGIFCRLSGEKPDFEESCEFFTGNRQEIEKLISEKKKREQNREDLIKTNSKIKIGDLLIPGKKYLFTPLIIYSFLIIYFLMIFSGVNPFLPDMASLIKWGGNYKILTYEGEYWRLATALFVHAGIIHLVANLYAFLIIAILLEPLIGKFRFGTAFLLTGIAASLTTLWQNVAFISVGASGAILGLFGIYIALLTTSAVSKKTRIIILPSMLLYIVFNIFAGLVNPLVDNAAHIGGFISGLIMGYLLLSSIKYPEDKIKNSMRIITFAVAVAIYSVIVFQRAEPVVNYQKLMLQFTKAEKTALSYYRLPEDSHYNDVLYALEYTGFKNWTLCLNITYSIDIIYNLPDEVYKRNDLIRKYIKKQQLIYRFLELKIMENTNEYDERIKNDIKEMNLILQKLNAQGFSAEKALKIAEHAQKEYVPYKKPAVKKTNTSGKHKYFFINSGYINDKNAFFVLNGKVISSKFLNKIDENDIKRVDILDNKAAVSLYGKNAENKIVFLIETYSK